MESCGGSWPPPEPDAGQDAGHDATRPDVGLDAARDAGVDADAPIGPTDPGWVHVAALPDECEIDVATFPERVIPVGTWTADCGVGCQHWGNTGNLIYVGESGVVPIIATIGGTPEGSADPRRYTVFSELNTGRALFALRDRWGAITPDDEPFCFANAHGVGSGSIGVSARFVDFDAGGRFIERSWMSVLRHELAQVPTSVTQLVNLDGWGELQNRSLHLSPSYMGGLFGSSVVTLFGNDGSHVLPTYGSSDTSEATNLEMRGEAELFWEAWRTPTVLVRSSNGAPPEVLRAVTGGDLRSFASDGNEFVWLEARGRDEATRTYASVELWTATYDGTALHAPRRVRTIPSHYDGGVGGGYYVHPEPNPTDPTDADFVFYRLSDGARALVDLPLPANEVLWVSDDDSVLEALGQRYRIDPRALTFE